MAWVTDHPPVGADLDACVTCGLCLPVCPTFRLTGDESASPRGRLAAIASVGDGLATVDDRFDEVTSFCLQCRACETACPSMVPYGEIIEAARSAQIHKRIKNMADGYQTILNEKGLDLSAGERQRIAIARALLMDPHILILDDSTSSVDMQTEQLIQKALWQLMEGRTTFVIAHRLSTVQRADLILVMESRHKRVIEENEPMVRGKVFRLGEWQDLEIPDPHRMPREAFEDALAMIDKGVADWVERLKN